MAIPAWIKAHRKRLVALFVLLLLIFCLGPSLVKLALSSLLSPSEKLDDILRSSPVCIAPCWRSITPGRSTEAEFLTLVNNSSPLRFANGESTLFHASLFDEGKGIILDLTIWNFPETS